MKCKNCGHKNKKNSQFCIACGEPLENESKGINKVIVLVIIVILLIAAGGFMIFNNSSKTNEPINEVINNTAENNDSVDEVVDNTPENNDSNNDKNDKSKTISQTITDEVTDYIQIYGVSFTVPTGGHHRTACAYQFQFNGQTCEVEEVEHYEYSDSQRTIEPYDFSKSYSGGEGYKLTVNNHVWKGIKVEKDDKWFHISMRTNNNEDVLELLDWMYDRNSWIGHD